MPVVTTVGPLREDTRDALKDYRDEEGHPNYETAVSELLKLADENETAD